MAYQEAKEEEPEFQKFENKGDCIEGKYVEVKESRKYTKVYVIEKMGKPHIVWGTIDLNAKMAKVPLNSKVLIEYLGEIPTNSGNNMKEFKVLFDDSLINTHTVVKTESVP